VSDASHGDGDTLRSMGEYAPAFQLYVRDWLISTATMTDEQSGAYMRLLCYAWDAEGLPTDVATIQAIGRWTDEQWARIWPAVSAKWKRQGSKLVNRRQEMEREGLKRYREAAKRGGKRSAEVRSAQRVSQVSLNDRSNEHATSLQRNGNTSLSSSIQDQKTTTVVTLAAREPKAVESSPIEYSPGQIRASMPGLVGAWNNVAAAHPPLAAVTADKVGAAASRALARQPDISFWADVFQRVTRSDYLMGRDGKHAPITIWFALDKAEEIAGGKFDNRAPAAEARPVLVEKPPPYYRTLPTKAEGDAAFRERLRAAGK
jgi:uncharacterized protein YdaU (DUF1376 family)